MEEVDVEPTTTVSSGGFGDAVLFTEGEASFICTETQKALLCFCFCRFVSISKNYRSVIRACMEELQQGAVSAQDTSVIAQYSNQVSILLAIELIWNLCEVLFIDAAPAGVLLLHLLDWVRLHKADVDERAREVLQSESPTHHHAYWEVVISFVLQGRMDEARQVLVKQANLQPASRPIYQLMDSLLQKMPIFNPGGTQTLTEFDVKWRHWHEECDRCLQDNSFASNRHLETICKSIIIYMLNDVKLLLWKF
uniref:Nuclear pore complex protein Nup85 n=1 Tax=Astyanax mexicanus TaxID=7994 RepID=A0A8B9HDW5_ASTMX